MEEIDQMLDQWIHNSIIRAKLRELIVYKLNTNKDGWNGNDEDDNKNIEWYLSQVICHNLNHCKWMAHEEPGVITN